MPRGLTPSELIRKEQARAKGAHLELAYLAQLRAAGLPTPERQVQIIPGRRWAWDAVYRSEMIAVEIDGGTWGIGGHSTGTGIARDREKSNAANLAGWCVLGFTTEQVRSGYALETTREALKNFYPF